MNMENLNKICGKFAPAIIGVVILIVVVLLMKSTDTSAEEKVCEPVINEKPVVLKEIIVDPKDKLIKYISSTYRATPMQAKDIVDTVYSYSDSTDFPPPHLVFAVIAVESSFRHNVKSHAGAMGLMQVMPVNEPGTTVEDNIIAGIWVLQKYRARVTTEEAALQAYNVGITAYKKGRRSQKYLSKVQREKKRFEVLTFNNF